MPWLQINACLQTGSKFHECPGGGGAQGAEEELAVASTRPAPVWAWGGERGPHPPGLSLYLWGWGTPRPREKGDETGSPVGQGVHIEARGQELLHLAEKGATAELGFQGLLVTPP